MIIYNITVKVDWSIHAAWLLWMRQSHIKDVMDTGCFSKYQMVRLLKTDDEQGPTYALQFYAENMDDYTRYMQSFANALRQKNTALWGDKFVAFGSLMQIVH